MTNNDLLNHIQKLIKNAGELGIEDLASVTEFSPLASSSDKSWRGIEIEAGGKKFIISVKEK